MSNLVGAIIVVPVAVLIFALLIVLQIYLSKQKNKWFGLFIPALYLLIAAFASFGLTIYRGDIAPIIIGFTLFSIPALINLLIYLVCRTKIREKNKKELEKMNIQDLD